MALQFPNPNQSSNQQPFNHQQHQPLPTHQPMMDTSPYTAPQADMETYASLNTMYNASGVFSLSGRIGRVQYIAYPLVFLFIVMIVSFMLGISAGGIGAMLSRAGSGDGLKALFGGYMVVSILLVFANYVFLMIYTVRRLNDMNYSGWISLVLLIPVVNLFFFVALCFVQGTDGENDYGLPPEPPSALLKIVAGVMLATILSTILIFITVVTMLTKLQPAVDTTREVAEVVAQAQIDAQNAQNPTPIPQPQGDVVQPANATPKANNENLNTETIVFTAEDLAQKSGMPLPQPTPEEIRPVLVDNQPQPQVQPQPQPITNVVPVPHEDEAVIVNPAGNSDIVIAQPPIEPQKNQQGDMSYEDFMKMSEKPVFSDR